MSRRERPPYVGLDADKNGGITDAGRIVLDARVFGLVPDDETCAGWSYDQMASLYDRVTKAWEPFGHLVSSLPADLRERHAQVYDRAVARARAQGWNPELDDED